MANQYLFDAFISVDIELSADIKTDAVRGRAVWGAVTAITAVAVDCGHERHFDSSVVGLSGITQAIGSRILGRSHEFIIALTSDKLCLNIVIMN